MSTVAKGSLRAELRRQLRLATPVVAVQLGLMAMSQVDVAFLGRVDALEMAGVAIGSSASFVLLIFGMGLLSALDPVISQAFGAQDEEAIRRGVQRGIVIAFVASVPIGVLTWFIGDVLAWGGVDADVVPVARDYARISIVAVPAFLVFVALRQTMQAMHLLRPLVITIVLVNVLNAWLDWVLIAGHLGFPPMGARGCAWGTVIARWAMTLLLPVVAMGELDRTLWPPAPRLLDRAPLLRMLRLGLPIGMQFTVELTAFAMMALLIGRLGEDELAGHQVTMQLASLTFMVPLGISMAAGVRVGNEVGRGDADAMRRAAKVALLGGASVMGLAAVAFLLIPEALVRVYVNPELDPALQTVFALGVALLPVAALFQVFDGVQVVCTGVLRGLGDTKVPMWLHLAGFWGLALPVGWWLGSEAGLGPRGFWWGLAAGLGAVAVAQFLRLSHVVRRGVERVAIDAEGSGASEMISGAERDRREE